jgi:integrase/recombinase XerD
LYKGTLRVAAGPKTTGRTLPLRPEQILLFQEYLTRTRPLLLKNNKTPSQTDAETLLLSVRGNPMKPTSISAMFGRPLSSGQKVTPQLIRQSVIAHLLKSGQDLRVIQAFTGHKRVSSVEAYRLAGLDVLKAVIGKRHPLQ